MKSLLRVSKFTCFTVIGLGFWACQKPDYRSCFIPSATNIKVRQEVSFTNCSDYDKGFDDCTWYFGDGKVQNSVGTLTVTHKYLEAGKYKVRLVIGEKDNISEKTEIITVTD
ncbi:MAG: PKD domain-containing protein [Bacteroidia bacterium]|nr:PKD domain-containing protein [Bacteroidia bacterium]